MHSMYCLCALPVGTYVPSDSNLALWHLLMLSPDQTPACVVSAYRCTSLWIKASAECIVNCNYQAEIAALRKNQDWKGWDSFLNQKPFAIKQFCVQFTVEVKRKKIFAIVLIVAIAVKVVVVEVLVVVTVVFWQQQWLQLQLKHSSDTVSRKRPRN